MIISSELLQLRFLTEEDLHLFKPHGSFLLSAAKHIPKQHTQQCPQPNYNFQREVPFIQRCLCSEVHTSLIFWNPAVHSLIQKKNIQTEWEILLVSEGNG